MAEKLFNLVPTDIGRPISDFKLNFSVPDLEPLLKEVIDNAIDEYIMGHGREVQINVEDPSNPTVPA